MDKFRLAGCNYGNGINGEEETEKIRRGKRRD